MADRDFTLVDAGIIGEHRGMTFIEIENPPSCFANEPLSTGPGQIQVGSAVMPRETSFPASPADDCARRIPVTRTAADMHMHNNSTL